MLKHKETTKLDVTICAMAHMKFDGTKEELNEKFPDIFMNTCPDTRADLGADDYTFSVNGDNESVIVNKGLLQALVDQCQRDSSNESVYDDTRGTSYAWSDLNSLIQGMKFSDRVTKMFSHEEFQVQLDRERVVRADNCFGFEVFDDFLFKQKGEWKIDGDTWVTNVQLKNAQGAKATTTYRVMFNEEFDTVAKTAFNDIEIDAQQQADIELASDRMDMASNVLASHNFHGYSVSSSGDWVTDGNKYSAKVFLVSEEGVEAVSTLNISFQSGLTNVCTLSHDLLDFDGADDNLDQSPASGDQTALVSEAKQPQALDVLNTPIFRRAKARAIRAAIEAAIDASESPKGFEIDRSFTDCGGINTSEVITVIDEFGAEFGIPHSDNYYFIIDALCEEVTEHFLNWDSQAGN